MYTMKATDNLLLHLAINIDLEVMKADFNQPKGH
jgi:hypothetical protein